VIPFCSYASSWMRRQRQSAHNAAAV
jgi:hypothetical protein